MTESLPALTEGKLLLMVEEKVMDKEQGKI